MATPTITLSGNLLVGLGPNDKPSAYPLNWAMEYTRKTVLDLVYTTSQSHIAVPQGACTAPRFLFVEVYDGTLQLSLDSGGANPWTIGFNPAPADGDPPARLILTRYAAPTEQFYLSCTGPLTAKIWLFQ